MRSPAASFPLTLNELDGAAMIPVFDDNGYLPPGIHPATIDEVDARFGRDPEIRRVQLESLRWLLDAARQHGASRLVIDGSFVTDRPEPNDVDCVVLLPDDFLVHQQA